MIVYTVICRAHDAAILVELATESLAGGNAPQVTTALLEHLRDNPNVIREGNLRTFVHRNYEEEMGDDMFNTVLHACTVPINTAEQLDLGHFDEHFFHLWLHEGIYYCCLSDSPEPRHHKVAFACMQAICRDFTGRYSKKKLQSCNAYKLNTEFTPNLRSAMHYYNINREKLSRDRHVNELMTQVEDMKALLGRNIQLLLDRGEKVDRLMATTDRALRDSAVFRKRSDRVKKLKKLKMIKSYIILAGLILAICLVIGFTYHKNE